MIPSVRLRFIQYLVTMQKVQTFVNMFGEMVSYFYYVIPNKQNPNYKYELLEIDRSVPYKMF